MDYEVLGQQRALRPEDFSLEDGRWVARDSVPVRLHDDDVREGRENLEIALEYAPGFVKKIQLLNPDGTACSEDAGDDDCGYPVFITDDEDIPVLDLSISTDEIREEDEDSSTATVSITNGKTFADRSDVVTFAFAGTCDRRHGLHGRARGRVTAMTPGHQVTLSAGSTSVAVTLTAMDDYIEDGNETIEVSATHAGNAVGSTHTIRIPEPGGVAEDHPGSGPGHDHRGPGSPGVHRHPRGAAGRSSGL